MDQFMTFTKTLQVRLEQPLLNFVLKLTPEQRGEVLNKSLWQLMASPGEFAGVLAPAATAAPPPVPRRPGGSMEQASRLGPKSIGVDITVTMASEYAQRLISWNHPRAMEVFEHIFLMHSKVLIEYANHHRVGNVDDASDAGVSAAANDPSPARSRLAFVLGGGLLAKAKRTPAGHGAPAATAAPPPPRRK